MNANRQISGVLRGFDQFMNLVLDGTVDVKNKVDIGMVVSAGQAGQAGWALCGHGCVRGRDAVCTHACQCDEGEHTIGACPLIVANGGPLRTQHTAHECFTTCAQPADYGVAFA